MMHVYQDQIYVFIRFYHSELLYNASEKERSTLSSLNIQIKHGIHSDQIMQSELFVMMYMKSFCFILEVYTYITTEKPQSKVRNSNQLLHVHCKIAIISKSHGME